MGTKPEENFFVKPRYSKAAVHPWQFRKSRACPGQELCLEKTQEYAKVSSWAGS